MKKRGLAARQMPKLALAAASGCHLVLAASVHTGAGSDAPDFEPLLYQAWRRANVKVVVADAGYDLEANHRSARLDMAVRSVIPPEIGRPSAKPPVGRFRRTMRQRRAMPRTDEDAINAGRPPSWTEAFRVFRL